MFYFLFQVQIKPAEKLNTRLIAHLSEIQKAAIPFKKCFLFYSLTFWSAKLPVHNSLNLEFHHPIYSVKASVL